MKMYKKADEFNKALFDFVKQYVKLDDRGEYMCKSCDEGVNIKKYVYEGTYVEELDTFLSSKDLVLNGGSSDVGIESTIIDCSGVTPKILENSLNLLICSSGFFQPMPSKVSPNFSNVAWYIVFNLGVCLIIFKLIKKEWLCRVPIGLQQNSNKHRKFVTCTVNPHLSFGIPQR